MFQCVFIAYIVKVTVHSHDLLVTAVCLKLLGSCENNKEKKRDIQYKGIYSHNIDKKHLCRCTEDVEVKKQAQKRLRRKSIANLNVFCKLI